MEYINKCKVCGNIWCYTDKDIEENRKNSLRGSMSALSSMTSMLAGSAYHAYEQNKIADEAVDKIVDFDRCPKCNSRNSWWLTNEELNMVKKIEEKIANGYFNNTPKDEIIKEIKIFIENKEWISAEIYLEQIISIVPNESEVYFLKMYLDNKASNEEELIKKCGEKNILLKQSKNFNNIEKFGTDKEIEKIKELDAKILEYINESAKRQQEQSYNWAIDKAKNSMDLKELKNAQNILLKSDETECSKEHLQIINDKINKINKKKFSFIMKTLIVFLIVVIMVRLGNWFTEMKEKQMEEERLRIMTENSYNQAQKLMEANRYEEAISVFENILEYSDSKELMEECIFLDEINKFVNEGKDWYFSAEIDNGEYRQLSSDEIKKEIIGEWYEDIAYSFHKQTSAQTDITNFYEDGNTKTRHLNSDYESSREWGTTTNNILYIKNSNITGEYFKVYEIREGYYILERDVYIYVDPNTLEDFDEEVRSYMLLRRIK